MDKEIKVLFIEDSEDDTTLIVRQLQKNGWRLVHERVDTRLKMEKALAGRSWDLIIADYTLPGFSVTEALHLIQGKNLDIPFIIVSGTIIEEKAVELMKAGAHDYIMKDRLNKLFPAIERELRDARVRMERSQAQEEIKKLNVELEKKVIERTAQLEDANKVLKKISIEWQSTVDSVKDLVILVDNEATILRVNLATAKFLNMDVRDIRVKNVINCSVR